MAGALFQQNARTYTPGLRPSQPGLYVPYAHPFQDLPGILQDAGARFSAVERRRSRLRGSLVAFLVATMVLASAIDRWVGFGRSVFSSLVPWGFVGIALVLLATRRGSGWSRRGTWERARHFGCFALFLVPVVLFGGGALLGGVVEYPMLAAAILAPVALIVAVIRRSRRSAQALAAPAEPLWRQRLEAVLVALDTLRDDVAPGKTATGWLDLTGPEQSQKLVATGKALSGAPSETYRDDWWSLSVPLRDGNRVRITARDRMKLKRGFWRTRRKSKWKPGGQTSLSSVEVRLRVNPAVYRVKTEPAAPEVVATSDTLAATINSTQGLEAQDLIRTLSLLYKRLEPVTPSGG